MSASSARMQGGCVRALLGLPRRVGFFLQKVQDTVDIVVETFGLMTECK